MKENSESEVSIAVPNKGRLSQPTLDLFRRAGLAVEEAGDRRLFAKTMDGRVRVVFVRAQDVPELVQDGRADLGVTGLDLVEESRADVHKILDLRFGACRLVVAAPEKSGYGSFKDLPNQLSVATSYPNLTRQFFKQRKKRASIIPVSGATEIMPHIGVADAVTDLAATGSTLAMNQLVELETVISSTAWLVGSQATQRAPKKSVAQEVKFALKSVVDARRKRYLMMDVPTKQLDAVREIVPGIAGPTVNDIHGDPTMKAVHVVVDEDNVYDAMRKLKKLGARGILVVPIDRMVA